MVREVIARGYEKCVPREAPLAAGAVITPGMVTEIGGDGSMSPWSGGSDVIRVAYNDDFMTKEDDYTTDPAVENTTERVKYVTPPNGISVEFLVGEGQTLGVGDEVYALPGGTVGAYAAPATGEPEPILIGEVDGREEGGVATAAGETGRVLVEISN